MPECFGDFGGHNPLLGLLGRHHGVADRLLLSHIPRHPEADGSQQTEQQETGYREGEDLLSDDPAFSEYRHLSIVPDQIEQFSEPSTRCAVAVNAPAARVLTLTSKEPLRPRVFFTPDLMTLSPREMV